MNERYKFRAWLKKEKKMVEVVSINFNDKVIAYNDNEKQELCINCSFEDIELMLGLKIYDEIIFVGDVVNIYGGEQMFGYYEFDEVKVIKELEDLVTLSNLDCGIEAIGNIYDELLEENNAKNKR